MSSAGRRRETGAAGSPSSSSCSSETSKAAPSASTMSSSSEGGSLGFWLLLSGAGVVPTHPAPSGARSRVVLLHGWLMSHQCWLGTAAQLRDRYGHDVLLFDFLGHGRSPPMRHYKDYTPEAYVAQLRRVLQHVGWASRGEEHRDDENENEHTTNEELVLCGLSLGGVVSLRYSDLYPEEVGRIILVASPGLDERWYMPPSITYPIRRAMLGVADAADAGWLGGGAGRWMVRRFGPLKTFLSHVHLVRDTPTFGVPQDMPTRLKSRGKPLVLVWGLLDQFHTPQLRRWKAGRPHACDVVPAEPGDGRTTNGREGTDERRRDAGVQIHVEPLFDHFAACMLLDSLRLAARPHFWHDAPPPPPRSRL